jgi:hypothetical protein
VPDREVERVEAAEDRCERFDRVLVHDQLAVVRASVEAVIADGQDSEVCERDRAAGAPEVRGDDLVLKRAAERARGGVEADYGGQEGR